jgi:DNA-binding Xre family transcriptional regulator
LTPLAGILAERGISQYELRRRTLLSQKTISNAYHGRSASIRTWARIARALDVKLADLVPPAATESTASSEHGTAPD